jgi:hypothetical protein
MATAPSSTPPRRNSEAVARTSCSPTAVGHLARGRWRVTPIWRPTGDCPVPKTSGDRAKSGSGRNSRSNSRTETPEHDVEPASPMDRDFQDDWISDHPIVGMPLLDHRCMHLSQSVDVACCSFCQPRPNVPGREGDEHGGAAAVGSDCAERQTVSAPRQASRLGRLHRVRRGRTHRPRRYAPQLDGTDKQFAIAEHAECRDTGVSLCAAEHHGVSCCARPNACSAPPQGHRWKEGPGWSATRA